MINFFQNKIKNQSYKFHNSDFFYDVSSWDFTFWVLKCKLVLYSLPEKYRRADRFLYNNLQNDCSF